MTLFAPNTKDIEKKLLEHEKEELEEYCKEQGFTKEETEVFVKNSIKNRRNDNFINQ